MKPTALQPKDGDKLSPSRTISLRLDEAALVALQEQADALNLTPGELAKLYLRERIMAPATRAEEQRNYETLFEGLRDTFLHVLEARRDVALGIQVLLSRAGQVTDEQAAEWVKKNYVIPCSQSPQQ